MRSIVTRSCCLAALTVLSLSGAIAACSDRNAATSSFASGQGALPSPAHSAQGAPGSDPLEGVSPETLQPLAAAPAFDSSSGLLTITVAPGELGMVSLRSVDNAIIVNGVQAVDATVTPNVSATSTNVVSISIVEPAGLDAGAGGTMTTEFIVDYTNGLFAKGINGGGGISLAFGGGEATLFGVKGTTGADVATFGATGVNMNGDGYADITFGGSAPNGGVGTFVVSLGNGDDTWYAGGDSATGARFDNDAPTNGATGYGAGVVVYGGAGNDTFNQGASPTPYETMYGGGQAGDTLDYSQRTAGVNVTLSVPGIANTVSGHCALPGDAGADASDAGVGPGGCSTDEYDDVKNDFFIVSGGSGDDYLIASTTAIIASSGGADAGMDAGLDAGRADAGDAGDAGRVDAGDAGDAGRDAAADSGADAGRTDSGAADAAAADAGPQPGKSVIFNGGAGNDTLTPYGGPYVMNGGAGNDTFLMGVDSDPHGAGTINGGAGVDYVDFSGRTGALKVTMDGVTKSGTFSGGAVTEGMTVGADVENLHCGSGNDAIVGNALDNVLNGGLGADTITGGGGNDTADYSDRAGAVWVALDGLPHSGTSSTFTRGYGTSGRAYTDGSCTISSSTEGDTVMPDIQNVTGGQGDDCLFGQPVGTTCTGTQCQNTLTGGPGNDMLFGYDDDDILEGSGGVGGDGSSDSNYLDCGGGYGNTGHDLGVTPPGYKASCQF